jgi:hypothetical protein
MLTELNLPPDEPTSGLDPAEESLMVLCATQLQGQDRGPATHTWTISICDAVALLVEGRLASTVRQGGGPTSASSHGRALRAARCGRPAQEWRDEFAKPRRTPRADRGAVTALPAAGWGERRRRARQLAAPAARYLETVVVTMAPLLSGSAPLTLVSSA